MTIDELLELARSALDRYALLGVPPDKLPADEMRLAAGILEILGIDAAPCIMPEPEVYPDQVIITREMVGPYEPDDAQAQGVALIRAAERSRGPA